MKKFLVLLLTLLLAMSLAAAEDTVTTYDFESGVPSQFLQSGSATPVTTSKLAHSGSDAMHVKGRSGNN